MRKIYQIAQSIKKEWKDPHYTAVPYLNAMLELEEITDNYYADSAKSVVLYFLSNASTFKGEKARELKKELKSLL